MVIQQEERRARKQQEASYGIRYRTDPAGVGQLGVADLVGHGNGGCGTPICGNRYRRAVEVSHKEAAAVHRGRHIARNWLTEKGERFVKAHVDRVPEAEAAALGAMTAAERDALIRLTGRYRALFAQKLNCI